MIMVISLMMTMMLIGMKVKGVLVQGSSDDDDQEEEDEDIRGGNNDE